MLFVATAKRNGNSQETIGMEQKHRHKNARKPLFCLQGEFFFWLSIETMICQRKSGAKKILAGFSRPKMRAPRETSIAQ